jgi:riboflavin kinase/FMN adenylyltransferase
MKVVKGVENLSEPLEYAVVAIGNFDGVHIGHQSVFSQAARLAREKNGTAVALTFDPHPIKLLDPERSPRFLTKLDDKSEKIGECGIDLLAIEPFTWKLADLTAEAFVETILVNKLKTRVVIVGSGFSFGQGRKGNVQTLETLGKKFGFSVEMINPIQFGGKPVSSTRIRKLVEEGDLENANRLLGRTYCLSGIVIKGKQRGNKIGFPTANIETGDLLTPACGVYACTVQVKEEILNGVVNVGNNPTFNRNQLVIEAHIFDFNKQLYGEEIKIGFVERIRSEKAFPNVDALTSQIQKDIQTAKTILAEI